jgi:hypothetical protein
MSSTKVAPAILHIRDFLESVTPDPARPDQQSALQLHCLLNIPFQADYLSDDAEALRFLLLCFFCPIGRSHLYEANVFIYAWGPFFTINGLDGQLQLILQANELDW